MSCHVTAGPKINNPSFYWVICDVIEYIKSKSDEFEFSIFSNTKNIPQQADIVIFSKRIPNAYEIVKLKDKKLVYIPIDHYNSKFELWSERSILRTFDAVLLHNNNLIKYLPNSIKCYHIDHYAKYIIKREQTIKDKLLWIGVNEYLAITLRYLIDHNIKPDDIILLSDIQNIRKNWGKIKDQFIKNGLEYYEITDNETLIVEQYDIGQWTEEKQKRYLATCKACIDIKNNSFRHLLKPATKCQLHVSSGIPQFVNDQHPGLALLRVQSIYLKRIEDIHTMSKDEIEEYGKQLKISAANTYSLENVAASYIEILHEIYRSNTNTNRSGLLWKLNHKIRRTLFEKLNSETRLYNMFFSLITLPSKLIRFSLKGFKYSP
jgi:hypothetical protein